MLAAARHRSGVHPGVLVWLVTLHAAALTSAVQTNTPPTVRFERLSRYFYPVGSPVVLRAIAEDTDGFVETVSFFSGTNLLSTDRLAPFALTDLAGPDLV